jgi:exonuclease III
MAQLRIATFNLENLDETATEGSPDLPARIPVLRQALARLRADVLCLQEIHGQERPGQPRQLLALDEVLAGTAYQGYSRFSHSPSRTPSPTTCATS